MTDNRKWPPKLEIDKFLKLDEISIEFPTANLGFTTTYSSKKKQIASDGNINQQPEIAIWPPKLDIFVSLEL